MKISNQYLTATFKTKGAELISLKKGDQEYIWQADPAHWGRHAPVLFPIVGKLKDNSFRHEGKQYELGQHGFARDQDFKVMAHEPDAVSFLLEESEDSLDKYPFRFELIITYRLKELALEVNYEVKNPATDKDLFFSIGAHPAFNCPINADERRSDYWLSFNQVEEFTAHRLTGGNFSGETETIGKGRILKITDELFDKDALVFKNLNSSSVSLQNAEKKWVTFHFSGFPYLGIWSKSAESPFVCIEPWFGLADNIDHDQKLRDKEGIHLLLPKEVFSCNYQVEIH